MPLIQSCSEEARQSNIEKLIDEGYSPEQAAAIIHDMCDNKSKTYRFGTKVKALGQDRVGGYLVVFSDADHRDLQGEYFTPETDLCLGWYSRRPALYQHGFDQTIKSSAIGIIDKIKQDDIGIWAEAQLDMHHEYKEGIRQLIDAGVLSWSSGSLPHLVITDDDGQIKYWPIVEGSLTPTPAMPVGTEIKNIKSFTGLIKDVTRRKEPIPDDNSASEGVEQSITHTNSPGRKTMGTQKQGPGERIMALLDELKEIASALIGEVADDAGIEMTEAEAAPIVEEATQAMADVIEESGILDEAEEMKADGEMTEEEEKELSGKMLSVIKENIDTIIPKSLQNRIRKQERLRSQAKSIAQELAGEIRNQSHQSVKGKMGGFQMRGAPNLIGRAEKPGLISFIKCAYNRDFREFYGKAQNPYIGERGGYLLGQELSNEILPKLREEVVMFNAGVKQTTVAQGTGSITVPKMTTAPTAYRPGINQPVSSDDSGFDQITAFLRPIAAISTIPFQLINQSPLAVEQTIRDELIKSISLQVDIEILEGAASVTGSNTGAEIKGVKTVLEGDSALFATNAPLLATNGRTPKFSDLVDAETQIANGNVPDREPKAWVMNARSRGRFRGLETTTGEPLLRENFGNEPYPRLLGYPLWIGNQITNDKVAGTSSDTTEIYFGAWGLSEYFMQNEVEVIVDSVTLANQLQMRIIAYTYSDFIVHYPEAFYVMRGVR